MDDPAHLAPHLRHILDDEITFIDRMKADLMGQAQFLKDSYVSRGELHANAAVVLDTAYI